MAKIEKVYTLNTSSIISGRSLHFFVIGAGGTGGYLIPNLARQVSILNNHGRTDHKLTIADADAVEDTNLVRQNFIQMDIGQNKAEVMANRYSSAFGMEIGIMPEYVETEGQLTQVCTMYNNTIPVIVGAVDNNKSRQLIYKFFKDFKSPIFWIDSGNGEYTGQVCIGYNNSSDKLRPFMQADNFYLPCVADYYHDIIDDVATKFISEMSCAERAIHEPQCIATNITAASLIFDKANLLMNTANMGGINSNLITFNTRTLGFTHFPNTEERMRARYTKPKAPVQHAEQMAQQAAAKDITELITHYIKDKTDDKVAG